MPGEQVPSRIVIEGITPQVDGGRFPAKRTIGDNVTVEADVFTDGHDAISAMLRYRHESEGRWDEVPMRSLGNDRWTASFVVDELGTYLFGIVAWVDHFKSWRNDLIKRIAAKQVTETDLLIGANLLEAASLEATAADQETLKTHATTWRQSTPRQHQGITRTAVSDELLALMERNAPRSAPAQNDVDLRVQVDSERARYGAWYELFPRSTSSIVDEHGTLRDVEHRLSYISELGFDVLYLPPIHPIGETHRKGRNNTEAASAGDPGSPWGIGSMLGGHKAIHPQLGTLEDFRHLVASAQQLGIEIALDIALQCSPDHPYVTQHPEWFRHRPDGTIQYAENPPKKYQDIYPINFETNDWQALWAELKSIFSFWIEQGVRIFRVDNPHTKPFPFWEWVIGEVRRERPDAIFLAEAFTRPKVMYRLAKLGFSQSYTYFAWRNTRQELTSYFTELVNGEPSDFFRPNLWPNTPDILTEYLQHGGRPAFAARFVLAATLGASYGIYGPAFELLENQPREEGSEEYLSSEKYEVRNWEGQHPGNLRELIARVNGIRRAHPALHRNETLQFHAIDNEQIIAYSKSSGDGADTILTVVNLDPHHTHTGWLDLDLAALDLDPQRPFQMHDLLTGARYLWQGSRSYVQLDPSSVPAHIFLVRHRMRSEHDFDYFL